MQLLRIKLEPTPESEHHTPFFFDIVLDEYNKISGKHAIFGVQGDFDNQSEHFYPCCIRSNGRLDYGTGFEPGDRNGQTDLRDIAITDGALVHFSISNEDDLPFRARIERSFP